MYHGILIDQEFKDKRYPKTFRVFATKQSGSWKIYGVEIENEDLNKKIDEIQANMRVDQPWYAHLYNDKSLIVIFKEKVFKVIPHSSSWNPIVKFGKKLKIPQEQLDFWPNRFQDEHHYF